MTLENVYKIAGGDLEVVLKRIPSRSLILKLVRMFLDDPSKSKLDEAIEAENCEEAFKAVHTLKGVSLNLGFDNLSEHSMVLTESLRGGNFSEGWRDNYEKLCSAYNLIADSIKKIED